MEEVVNFIQNYWSYISVVLVFIFNFILFFIRKPTRIALPVDSYGQLISLINEAEAKFGSGHGKDKLDYVIDKFVKSNAIFESFENDISFYAENMINQILSTPTKKGGPGREKAK